MTHTCTKHSTGARPAALGAACAILVLSAGTAAAEWRFSVTPYAWATDIGVSAQVDGRQVIDKTIPVTDLLEDINTIFQMKLEAQNGALGASIDLFDVTLADELTGVALPDGAGQAAVKSDVGMTLLDVAGFIDPKGDHRGFSALYGLRFINERATVDATLDLATGSSVPLAYETDDWTVDALVGVRYAQRLSGHWGLHMQADVSTGETDYTWSLGPSLSYAFGQAGRYSLSAGYRRMVIDYEDDGNFGAQMIMSGAQVGFRASF